METLCVCVCVCVCVCIKSVQLRPTLCESMDFSPPGSTVHGILQARILEWVAIPSSRGSSQSRDRTHISCLLHWQAGSLPLALRGKPMPLNIRRQRLGQEASWMEEIWTALRHHLLCSCPACSQPGLEQMLLVTFNLSASAFALG